MWQRILEDMIQIAHERDSEPRLLGSQRRSAYCHRVHPLVEPDFGLSSSASGSGRSTSRAVGPDRVAQGDGVGLSRAESGPGARRVGVVRLSRDEIARRAERRVARGALSGRGADRWCSGPRCVGAAGPDHASWVLASCAAVRGRGGGHRCALRPYLAGIDRLFRIDARARRS